MRKIPDALITADRHVDTQPEAGTTELATSRTVVRTMDAREAHRITKRKARRDKRADKAAGVRADRRTARQALRADETIDPDAPTLPRIDTSRLRPEPHPREVLQAVAAELPGRVTVGEIKGPKRWPGFDLVRKACALALRRRGCSYPEIGQVLGGRHHTSAINLVQRALALEFAEADTPDRALFRAAVRAGKRVRGGDGCGPCSPRCPLCAQSANVDEPTVSRA